ncbi:hypothetical protein [Streptomyces violarus]|uniref:hypothetical protein n=1 Tax=Streptomyces violarus TaxID=67380 RepID=UPI0021C24FB3|nr:hypothetical protein [Streptomyces violarus]MCT9140341.1 hypothetical protein [Streptomyces violarus]
MKALARPDVVPYISAWSGEQPYRRPMVYSPQGGIAYADETPADRDRHGVLWNGRALAPGVGRPEFGNPHPQRHRRAQQRMLCQVCQAPAGDDPRGVLWLLEDRRGDWSGWPNDLLTAHPPICPPCARATRNMCPHLSAVGHVAVRVRSSEVCGVHGRLWVPSGRAPARSPKRDFVAYGTPAAQWVLAGQLVRSLHDCTFVDLDRETGQHP